MIMRFWCIGMQQKQGKDMGFLRERDEAMIGEVHTMVEGTQRSVGTLRAS